MDVMLDIETLSTRPHAVILTIGAIRFDRKQMPIKIEDMDTFYRRVYIDSCTSIGMHIEESTKEWWEGQSKEARFEAFDHPDRVPIKQALEEFKKWFSSSVYLWSHGDDFDTVILSEAFTRCGIEKPWKFWYTRDTRTIFDIAGIRNCDLPQHDKHHALFDCHRQIYGVARAFQIIRFQPE